MDLLEYEIYNILNFMIFVKHLLLFFKIYHCYFIHKQIEVRE
jgi:hypothetical protein